MIVSIDVQSALTPPAGVGRYTRALMRHLGPWAGSDELIFSYFDFRRRPLPALARNARHNVVRWLPRRLAQYGWKTIDWPPYDWLTCRADVYHFPNFIRPPLTRGKSIITVHDLSLLRFPETVEEKYLRFLGAKLRESMERADAVLTMSVFVANEVHELMAVPSEKIHPIHTALTEHIARPDAATVASVRERLGLARPYLLTVGTMEPRKNITFLVDVFERMKHFDGDLLLVGARGWKCEPIFERIAASRLAERIKWLGYVADGDLPALYAGAELFVFPSLYEGFGLTPLEAMACGTPVVSSTGGSLPEVLGDAAILIDTLDADCWADTLLKALSDPELRSSLVSKGFERARCFSWREVARKTWDVYRRVGRPTG